MIFAAALLSLASATDRLTPPSVRLTTPAIEQRLLETFRPLVGVREVPLGSNRGPRVDEFNRAAKTALGSPWCASVAVWGYQRNGLRHGNAYSPSWYDRAKVVPRNRVQVGDIGLVWFPSKGRWAHVIACVEAVRGNSVVCLEGNTNAQGSREGHGFFRRIRRVDSLTFVRWREAR